MISGYDTVTGGADRKESRMSEPQCVEYYFVLFDCVTLTSFQVLLTAVLIIKLDLFVEPREAESRG